MLLTIETKTRPASDIGFLFHKNPARVHSSDQPFGKVHIFYPACSDELCRMAMLLEVDPLALVRGRGRAQQSWALGQYVNDRAYSVNSLLTTAMTRELNSAMKGRSKERPELAASKIELKARLCPIVCRAGAELIRQLFEPLGYQLDIQEKALDDKFPAWGPAVVFDLSLSATARLSDLLVHLYVLIPVMDDDKHYWITEAEVEKLMRFGEGWLETHPARDLIIRRYLKHQGSLMREANSLLAAEEAMPPRDSAELPGEQNTATLPLSLHKERINSVLQELIASGAERVLDLGCGEGLLLEELLKHQQFSEIVGVDVSIHALNRAAQRLNFSRMPPLQKARITLQQGALTYRDKRLRGFDAAALIEVIEHLDAERLLSLERSILGDAAPGTLVVTTPNSEYNRIWESLPAGRLRHGDHRFEWTRAQFSEWAARVAGEYGYSFRVEPLGPLDEEAGAPSQMAVFTR